MAEECDTEDSSKTRSETSHLTDSAKKIKLFSSIGKALRKRPKSKSKSLTDLHRSSSKNGKISKQDSLDPVISSTDKNSLNDYADGVSIESSTTDHRSSVLYDENVNVTGSIGSRGSSREINDLDDNGDVINPFELMPPGTTMTQAYLFYILMEKQLRCRKQSVKHGLAKFVQRTFSFESHQNVTEGVSTLHELKDKQNQIRQVGEKDVSDRFSIHGMSPNICCFNGNDKLKFVHENDKVDLISCGSVSIMDITEKSVAVKSAEAVAIWKSGVCSFFSVEGEIVTGHGLIARDKSGTSDPYVKVKLRHKSVFKSKIIYRDLNPVWNESFQLAVDDVNTELVFKVYDFDRLSYDDDMGEARVGLGGLEINKEHELTLPLINKQGFQEDLGKIVIKLSIIPKTPNEKLELAQLMSTAKRVTKHGSKGQIYDSLVSVILVEGKNLKAMDPSGLSDPYIRFKLGTDKYKSKVCKQTLSPIWHEQFDMKTFTANNAIPPLEITVWDKDSGKDEFMGRATVDLRDIETEKSHYFEIGLEDQPGTICLYVTITAQSFPGCPSDLNCYDEDPSVIEKISSEFSIWRTPKSFKHIGWLQLKLHRAVGLAVMDYGGASDPFAVIELGNQRLVTPTIYKTLNPQWDKIYELIVYDVHDIIEVTVYDEDKRGAPEFLGRVQIPLLSLTSWEKRLYQLKDKRLQAPAKGHLIMSFGLIYNPIRASIRTFNPKEERILDEPPRFRRQLLQQNVDRLTNVIRSIIATGEFIQSLFTWKYKLRSGFAFTIYILLVMNFDWFMLPLILFLVLLKNYIVFMLSPNKNNQEEDSHTVDEDEDEDEDDEKNKKGRTKTFREKLEAINNICMLVQNHMNNVASFGERIKNTFNWSVPFLSYLLMVLLLLGTIVLYVIPLRYLLLAWGINKFTKRIRKPNAIANNEVLDFLSRIPSDPEIKQRRPLKTDVVLR